MKENNYIYFHQILEVKEVWQEMRTNSRHCEPGCAAAASPAEARAARRLQSPHTEAGPQFAHFRIASICNALLQQKTSADAIIKKATTRKDKENKREMN